MSHIEIFDSRYARLKAVDWDFTDASQDSLASIHPYPARFIPDIPRELISGLGCDKGAVILDPFCGSWHNSSRSSSVRVLSLSELI